MKKLLCSLLFIFQALYSFEDAELTQLWSSINDITNPSLEEYKIIENYLSEGERAYLRPLTSLDRLVRIRNFKLLGPGGEMPVFEKHSINVRENTKNRCVLLFGSRNGIYPSKVRRALQDLKRCGYSGHVLIRIGGFPNLPNGGLKICHVPYAFKVAFLKEAQLLGYKEVLWIDTALHPLTNLEEIFSIISKKGCFFTEVGSLLDNESTHLPDAAEALGITKKAYKIIPHISSCMLGFNTEYPRSVQLIDDWLHAAENVHPFMTCWPEELSLSVLAWNLQLRPHSWLGNYVCAEHEINLPSVQQRPLQFFIDRTR